MEIKKCFEILELDPDASIEEAKLAYKDIVNVWHPDRFSHNSRLKEKAEKKLKELNIAYEAIEAFLSSKKLHDPNLEETPRTKPGATEKSELKTRISSERAHHNAHAETKTDDRIEAAAEAGTRIFLEVCSFLYTGIRRIIDKQVFNAEPKHEAGPKGPNQNQRRGQARGRGMGRKRGKGRAAGKGRCRR